MKLSRLSAICRDCSRVAECKHKKLEGLAVAELPKQKKYAQGGYAPNSPSLFAPGSVQNELIGYPIIPSDQMVDIQESLEESLRKFSNSKSASVSISMKAR